MRLTNPALIWVEGGGGVLDAGLGPLQQTRNAFIKQGGICAGNALLRFERIRHTDPVVPTFTEGIWPENPRNREFKSTDIDANGWHHQVDPSRAAVLVVPGGGCQAHWLARQRGVVVEARGKRVGQEVLLGAVQLRPEIAAGTEVHVGVEPAVGAGFGVLVVAPPHKELGAPRGTRIARCAAGHNARPRELQVAIETVAVAVLCLCPPGARCRGCTRSPWHAGVPVVPERFVPAQVLDEVAELPAVAETGENQPAAALLLSGGTRKTATRWGAESCAP